MNAHAPQAIVPHGQAGRSQAEQVASAIVKSGFWRDANPHAVLMLCYLAEAEGHHPAVVYRDYHMMSGKPSKKAEAILRDFIVGNGKVVWHQLDDDAADATFWHPSAPKGARITWTLERAKTAGIADRGTIEVADTRAEADKRIRDLRERALRDGDADRYNDYDALLRARAA